ncbi:MAG: RluA family pseudouridine synthase [Candidatus Omnitrophica bacterium]|nr:RluA family pseudouridine synthase [Candidatus Omnitrophota bacterium]
MDKYCKYKVNDIGIIYEDDWLLVADKPAGLLTIPSPKKEKRTLISILNDYLKIKGVNYRLHPCHRLNRETSGLIICAKGKSIQKKMMRLFKEKKVKKKYLVFIRGRPTSDRGKINYPIQGKNALTIYNVLERRDNFAIIEAIPLTGRTNQLRLHFKYIGHPILGETKYAFRRDFKLKAKRLCLHARELGFIHPITQRYIRLYSETPEDLKSFLSRNR